MRVSNSLFENRALKMITPHIKTNLNDLIVAINGSGRILDRSLIIKDIMDKNNLILGVFIDKSIGKEWHPMKCVLFNNKMVKLGEARNIALCTQ